MAGEFSTGQGVKIPTPVPLDQADPERQKLYKDLASVDAKLPEPVEVDTAPPIGIPPPPDPDLDEQYYQPTEDDKRAFVRSVLGGRSFEKKFLLFGVVEAQFVDRTTETTEQLYGQFEADSIAGKIQTSTDEAWASWLERYNLASTLRQFKDDAGIKSYPQQLNLNERVTELMKINKPLYQALMQAGRRFEAIVSTLTAKAHEPDFWKTGGASLPSKPTLVAR